MGDNVEKEILEAREIIKGKIAQGDQLTKKWSYILVCDSVEEVNMLLKNDHLIEAAKNRTLTREELKELCETVFRNDKETSRLVFLTLIKNKKINSSLSEEELKELDFLNSNRQKNNKR